MYHVRDAGCSEYYRDGQNYLSTLFNVLPKAGDPKFPHSEVRGNVSHSTSMGDCEVPAQRLLTIYHGTRTESSKIFRVSCRSAFTADFFSFSRRRTETFQRLIHFTGVLQGRFKGFSK
jgi:hypothetical protein